LLLQSMLIKMMSFTLGASTVVLEKKEVKV
jgi:hypothetical protein